MKNPLNIVNQSKKKLPWYTKGLRFKCTGCGECCTGSPGYVWIHEEEIMKIADFLKMSIDEFSKKYIRQVGSAYSLKEDSRTFDCVFLKDKKCTIYQVRPKQCQLFPWWVQNLSSEENWKNAAKFCEGIDHPDAPVICFNDIKSAAQASINIFPSSES